MRQTKIVATIGPASETKAVLPKLLKAGVDVVRLNFSHGSYEEWRQVIRDVRAFSKATGRHVGIMQDLQGPKVRVGIMSDDTVLRAGSIVTFTTKPVIGDATNVPLQYKKLPRDVRKGDTLLLNDGLLEVRVLSTAKQSIKTKVIHGGVLSSHKGINVPTATLSIPALTAKDKRDLVFGLEQDVDFVALSFVKSAKDVQGLRRMLMRAGSKAQIIAKIEKHEAVKNIGSIIDAADAVMVARGDLGVELLPEDVPLIQKRIIHLANRSLKPVITATQMLESMITQPRATRAEVSDVANAILDGTDAVMLSAETATGAYPVEAVQTLVHTASKVEQFFTNRPMRGQDISTVNLRTEALSVAACELAHDVGARLLVVPTNSGFTARAVARHRIRKPVVALTDDKQVARQLTLVWGVRPVVINRYRTLDDMIRRATATLVENRLAKRGEKIILTAGWPLHQTGATRMVQIHTL